MSIHDLSKIAEGCTTAEEYIDRIWALRYPRPSPPSSDGWPVRKNFPAELPFRVVRAKR
ncbi:MAG: hypothetical protein ACO35B_06460 [Luminiphilus sp.]